MITWSVILAENHYTTYITCACDAVVLTVCPNAAIDHSSVLTLNETLYMKNRKNAINNLWISVKNRKIKKY